MCIRDSFSTSLKCLRETDDEKKKIRSESVQFQNVHLRISSKMCIRDRSYGVNLYYINGDNIIMTDPALRKNVNSGEIENWGVEDVYKRQAQ